jgi:hypothetical protein
MGIESTHHSASAGFQAIIQLVSNSMTYLFLNTVLSSQRGPQSVARVYGLLPKSLRWVPARKDNETNMFINVYNILALL